jgi:hypothetical protein
MVPVGGETSAAETCKTPVPPPLGLLCRSVRATVSVKTTLWPVVPVVPDGNAVSVALTVPWTYEVLKRLPSAGTRVRLTEAWPVASVVVVEALTVPKAFDGFTKTQETVAPGSGFPVASFTRTTAGFKTTAVLAQIVQMS